MGEGGIVERFFEGEEAEDEGEKLVGAADPIAAAIAIDAARFDPELSSKAGRYLDGQSRLIAIQTEHLHEQREVQLSHLKLRRWSERMRVGLQLFFVLLGTVIGLGILVMLYDAFTSKNVVVEAFESPPVLASRGLNGTVVATQVLDGLQKLQDATRGPSRGLATKSAWSSDIKVELPETGISIGEIDRLLHERFGHDVHVAGDLVQTPKGDLALTVRGDGIPAKTFEGPIEGLEALTTQAAEYLYGRSQPWLYAVYLANHSREQDALAFLPGAFARATDDQRGDLANVWGNAFNGSNQPKEAIVKYRLSMSYSKPHSPVWWKAWNNLISVLTTGAGEEAAWRESTRYLKAAENAPAEERPETRLLLNPAGTVWDLPLGLKALQADAQHNQGAGAATLPDGPAIADTYEMMHDPLQTDRALAASDPDDESAKIEADLIQLYRALESNHPASGIAPGEAFYRAWLADPSVQNNTVDAPCYLALAYGLSGRLADAQAVFKKTGPWARCFAFHGDVLAHSGDVDGAMRAWDAGLRIAPDLMPIYLHRGLFELSRGNLRAAQADLATAHAKAPHYADPLKAWGDVLARAGHWRAALAKYDEALQYAPAWAELHRARDNAAKRAQA